MPKPPTEILRFVGDQVVATSPEGTKRSMKLADLMRNMLPSVPDSCGAIFPDGVKCSLPYAGGVILVHQTPPQVYSFQWITNDSSQDFGPGTEYRTVRLALPYVVVLAVFHASGRGAGVPVLGTRWLRAGQRLARILNAAVGEAEIQPGPVNPCQATALPANQGNHAPRKSRFNN